MKHPRPEHLLLACAVAVLAACEEEPATGGGGPGPMARVVVISGDRQTGTAGEELPAPLVVLAEDAQGRPVPGQVLNFVVTAGAGTVVAPSVQTDAQGVARQRWVLATVVGDTQRVEVRGSDPATGLPATLARFRALARPGSPAEVQPFQGAGPSAMVGTQTRDSIGVIIRDRHGNPVPDVLVTWTTPNGGAVAPAVSRTTAQGIARTSWTLPTTAAWVSLTAQAGTAARTIMVEATPGPTTSMTVTPNPVVGPAGTVVQVEAVPRDQYGNPTFAPVYFSVGDEMVADIHYFKSALVFEMRLKRLGETTVSAGVRDTGIFQTVPVRVTAP